jgi:hypothetical protein
MEVNLGSRAGNGRTAVAVCLASIVGACALTWPLLMRLGGALPGNLGDPLLNATILGWNVQWLQGRRTGSFWDAPIFHPHENALAYSEHLIGQTLFVWPVFVLTDNALLTYNAAVLLSFPLLAVGSYLWIHALTRRRDLALVFALALTFSPYRMGAQLPRLQMLWIGFLPLAWWAIHRYGETGRFRFLVWVITGMTLLMLTNMYMLFLAPLPISFVMIFAVAQASGSRLRVAGGLALASLLTTLVLTPVVEPYRQVDSKISLEHGIEHTARYSAHPASYVSAHSTNVAMPWVRTETTGDQALYPGLVLLIPIVAPVVVWKLGIARDRRLFLYLAIGTVALGLSFGPATSPYAWLHEHLPGWSAVRAPGRFAAIVALSLAALSVSRLTARWGANARATLVAGALAIISLEALPATSRVEDLAPRGRAVDHAVYEWLARQSSGVMLELPASRSMRGDPNSELLHQFATLQHPHRLVNGYSGFNPPLAELFERADSPFINLNRLSEGVELLRSTGVRFVVVHPHDYADETLATDLISRMRVQNGVAAEHPIGDHYVFELLLDRRTGSVLPSTTRTKPAR